MTEMDIESTGSSRNEIGPQDRYFLPDPGFTPGHDRDAYRVTQVRAPIFLSRNEDFQLFSTFFRFFHPSPKTEVERGGKRWNANTKRVETGGTDFTFFHLFPSVSTSFHLKIFLKRNFTLKAVRRSPRRDRAAYRNISPLIATYFFLNHQHSAISRQVFPPLPAYSNVIQRIPTYLFLRSEAGQCWILPNEPILKVVNQ